MAKDKKIYQTMTEKIFSQKYGKKVFAGDKAVVKPDNTIACINYPKEYVLAGGMICGPRNYNGAAAAAFNALALLMSDEQLQSSACGCEMICQVPAAVKFKFRGEFPKHVAAKDLILFMLAQVSADGLEGRTAELFGELIETLTIDDRLTIAEMLPAMGVSAAIIGSSRNMLEWVSEKSGLPIADLAVTVPDEDAVYSQIRICDVSKLEPQVVCPGEIDGAVAASQADGICIDKALIGFNGGGRLDDLQRAADVLSNRTVDEDVKFFIKPASEEIFKLAEQQELLKIFARAGAVVLRPSDERLSEANCAEDYEVIMSAGCSNASRDLGCDFADIYLASAETVAASAVCGRITDPRTL